MSLLTIAQQMVELKHMADVMDIDEDLLNDTLESLEGTFQEKVEYLTSRIMKTNRFADICKAEEQRLADRRKSLEKRAESIKQYIQSQMMVADMTKLNYPLFTVSIQKNPPKVTVYDEELIPQEFKKFETVVSIDKKSILEALKQKVLVPGTGLEQGQTLRIK